MKVILPLTFLLAGCAGTEPYSVSNYSGNVIVSTVATDPATGPGVVAMFSSSGSFISTLRDLYSSGEFSTGVGFISPLTLIMSIDGVDRLETLNLQTNTISSISHVSLTSAPLRQVAVDSSDSIWVVEAAAAQQTIEKFTSSGSRVGNPFIATTTGSCVLATPWGIAYMPNLGYMAVISSAAAGRLSVYDTSGNCISHFSGSAPISTGTPTGIAYHPTTQKLLVTFSTTHAIWAMDYNGANATQIYLNSTIINTPKAIAADAAGYIYVGSNGTDTVEKLYWSGTGTATRALSGPLLGPNIYTQNPTAIMVVP